jgi:hypothetical protein
MSLASPWLGFGSEVFVFFLGFGSVSRFEEPRSLASSFFFSILFLGEFVVFLYLTICLGESFVLFKVKKGNN